MKRLTRAELPRSFGAFKPVGHVMLALPPVADLDAAEMALHEAGFIAEDILRYDCHEEGGHIDGMIERSSEFAGFGYEIVLMKRYKQLCDEGHHWLLVYAPHGEQAERVAELGRRLQSPMAVKYHRLAEEDLI